MSGLQKVIESVPSLQPGASCGVAVLLGALDREDRKALEAALGNESIPGAQIGRALVAVGHEMAGATIQRHRRGECRCEKAT